MNESLSSARIAAHQPPYNASRQSSAVSVSRCKTMTLHTMLLLLLVVLSVYSHHSYQTVQSEDSCGAHLPRLWNCNCGFLCVYYFSVLYSIVYCVFIY